MKSRYLSASLIILIFFAFTAGDEVLTKFLNNFERHSESHVQEKIYLHTDKPYYAIGDEIWFKAYLVDAQTMHPTAHSNLMNVELINSADSVIKTIKIPLAAGFGWGNFTLADSLNLDEGSYRIRAYTNWMRNFGEEFFYDHNFKVGDARSSQVITETTYSYSKKEKGEEVQAIINYRNMDGGPYANKPVSYLIEAENRSLAKGKGTTDQDGNITVTYLNEKPQTKKALISATISIAESTSVKKLIPINLSPQEIDVQFFPEGGDLVADVKSKVAFRAIGPDGKGKAIAGFIQSISGEKLSTLTTVHLGMGSFSLTPKSNENYEAVIRFENGSQKKIALPKAKEQGVVMAIGGVNQKDSLAIRVSANTATLNNNQDYYLVGQSSGTIVYTAKLALKRAHTYLMVSKKDFPTGISHFTIFNQQMLPLAERLAFIYHDDFLKLDVAANKNVYSNREKVNLTVKALDKEGKPAVGSFSMSVINESIVPHPVDQEHTILSELLLNSDLRGKVEQPNYYFNETNDQKLEELDLLLLTQGWRRFNWKAIQDFKAPNYAFDAEKTLNISGNVTHQNKPAANVQVTALSSTGGLNTLQTKTNDRGEFRFDSLLFLHEVPFMLSAGTSRDRKSYTISYNGNKKPKLNPSAFPLESNINLSMQAYLNNSRTQYEELLKSGMVTNSYLLKEVRVTADKTPLVASSANLNGPGNADVIITNKELVNAPNLETALLSRIPGAYIKDGAIFLKRSMGLSSTGPSPILIVIDGMGMSDALLSINPRDIESIEFLKTIGFIAIYGLQGNGGVLIVTTRRGGSNTQSIANTTMPNTKVLGYTLAKEFYSPAYDIPETRKNLKDLRSTIYWNPNIITDATGVAGVSYFNTDAKGTYKVVIEGIDLNGHLGRKVMRYVVK